MLHKDADFIVLTIDDRVFLIHLCLVLHLLVVCEHKGTLELAVKRPYCVVDALQSLMLLLNLEGFSAWDIHLIKAFLEAKLCPQMLRSIKFLSRLLNLILDRLLLVLSLRNDSCLWRPDLLVRYTATGVALFHDHGFIV